MHLIFHIQEVNHSTQDRQGLDSFTEKLKYLIYLEYHSVAKFQTKPKDELVVTLF